MLISSYTLVICLIVYVGLVVLFASTITIITKQTLKLTRIGAEDEKIKTEYLKNKGKKKSVIVGIINLVIPIVACVVMIILFTGSVVVGALRENVVGEIPVFKVVQSASMSAKYEKNEYLFENDLNDQLQVYDLILAHKLPDEKDLKKYDIVVYEIEPGVMLVHRIVNIEEPNDKHPNERHFLLQGDNVAYPDKFPVRYSQMKGIYRGKRIPFLGTLVVFMQTTAGVLCIMLIVFASIFTPFIERKFNKEKKLRLIAMGLISNDNAKVDSQVSINEGAASAQTCLYVEPIAKQDLESSETAITSDVLEKPTEQEIVENPAEQEIIEKPTTQEIFINPINSDASQEENTITEEKWYHSLKGKRSLTFKQKLNVASYEVIKRYNQIITHLYKIKGLKVWESKSCETYKKGRTPIAKIAFRGKTLAVYLALNPSEYENTKYVYDIATNKTYKDYKMCVKITSERQAKWTCELITEIANKNGLYLYALSKLLTIKGSDKTLEQKMLESSEQTRAWFRKINEYLLSLDGIRVISAKKQMTYKIKSKNVAKLKMIGKTLNLYLALEPKKFKNTKYKFINVSNKKAYEKYPMRVKITSDRQARWAIELIEKI